MTSLTVDSRTLAAGEVFLAYPGARRDGRDFIPSALERGAAAVLWERKGFEWNSTWKVPNLGVEDLRGLSGLLAHEVYGRPSEKLWAMGVTGTNGKTSCTHWIAQACGACGARTAVIGTDRKSTRLNSSHSQISYAVFCLKKKKTTARYSSM